MSIQLPFPSFGTAKPKSTRCGGGQDSNAQLWRQVGFGGSKPKAGVPHTTLPGMVEHQCLKDPCIVPCEQSERLRRTRATEHASVIRPANQNVEIWSTAQPIAGVVPSIVSLPYRPWSNEHPPPETAEGPDAGAQKSPEERCDEQRPAKGHRSAQQPWAPKRAAEGAGRAARV